MTFADITLVSGEEFSRRTFDTAALAPAAVEVFRDLERLELQWTEESPGSAVSTFWVGDSPLTLSVFLTGSDPYAERQTLAAVQQALSGIFRSTGQEYGFDLLAVADRPAAVTVPFPWAAGDPLLPLVADAGTCLAAAYLLDRLGGDDG